MGRGLHAYQAQPNSECRQPQPGSETVGAKLHRQKGNNPDRQLRPLSAWLSGQRMCRCRDNQEVGLEAATLERVRNSSLVECRRADNSPGLKPCSRSCGCVALIAHGRGASSAAVKRQRKPAWSGDECECRHE